jgi:acetate kinase
MILVLNAGSSSIKFKLFDDDTATASGSVERIGEPNGGHALLESGGQITERFETIANHARALELMQTLLRQSGLLHDIAALEGVGHRVVHGGETFREPVRIDTAVMDAIENLIPLAPLHNPANLEGIRAMIALAPHVPQVAVFDTAFHATLPPEAYRYALPDELYRRYSIRRYGFHGTSHAYVAQRAAELLETPLEELNLITLHLGNGASACAVRHGKSVDTSMGFTPLEGLVMGTRSGDLDPGIVTFLEREAAMSPDTVDALLNRQSGLKGLCGINDMREIETKMQEGDRDAALAFDVFIHRIRKYIGSYVAVLGSVDAIVFTGGIGEHSHRVREAVCDSLELFGIRLYPGKNDKNEPQFHDARSKIALLRIPTDEELAIKDSVCKLAALQ